MKIGIVGAAGYTGLSLLSLLRGHPFVDSFVLYAKRNAGQTVGQLFPHLVGLEDIPLVEFSCDTVDSSIDVLFLALPHAQSHEFMAKLVLLYPKMKIIDLSADFRLDDAAIFEQYYKVSHASDSLLPSFVYGLPELNRTQLQGAQYCAAPGCYSTASILSGLPLAKKGVLSSALVDAKSGVTGAGRSLKEGSLYCEANESFSAYGTGVHRHTAEIEMLLNCNVFFSPHLVPMNRGILASSYLTVSEPISEAALLNLYQTFYAEHSFVLVKDSSVSPSTKHVSGSNFCLLVPRVVNGQVVVFSAIDNLIKGASGQAIQCMNLMCGYDETLGLDGVASYV